MLLFAGKHCSVSSYATKLDWDSIIVESNMHSNYINYIMCGITAKCFYDALWAEDETTCQSSSS